MRRLAAVGLLILQIGALPAMGGTQSVCSDIHETYSATVSGIPDESLTGTAIDAREHQLTLGSGDCRIADLTATTTAEPERPAAIQDELNRVFRGANTPPPSHTPNPLGSIDRGPSSLLPKGPGGPPTDVDLEVDVGEITMEKSASPDANETVSLTGPPNGEYTFRVETWSSIRSTYTLTVDVDLEPGDSILGTDTAEETVVVAVVDSGINPYHEAFAASTFPGSIDLRDHPSTYIDGFPQQAPALDLTLDPRVGYDEAVERDGWDGVEKRQLYWIPGTKIVGAYHAGGKLASNTSILDEDGHGTASASLAAGGQTGTCPRCLIVAVEGIDGLGWALSQPWIDAVTNSWGNTANVGAPTAGHNEIDPATLGNELARETRHAVTRGQTVLFAAGNGYAGQLVTPQPTYTSPLAGPDWTVTVGAAVHHAATDCGCPEGNGTTPGGGKPVDVTGWAAGDIPAASHTSRTGHTQASGTSAATPLVAGVMADTLLAARERLGDTTNGLGDGIVATGEPTRRGMLEDGELTRAELEQAIKYGADHTRTSAASFPPPSPPTAVLPDQARFAQWALEGWGLVTEDTGRQALNFLEGQQPLPDRAFDEEMAAIDEEARAKLWGPPVEPSP